MTTKDWIKIVLIGCILSFLINTLKIKTFIDSNAAREQVSVNTKTKTVFPKGTFESEVKHTQ